MNKYDNGFGVQEKKINPLKVLGIIWLILVAVGIFIYARNYGYYYEHFKAFNNHEETTDNPRGGNRPRGKHIRRHD